MKKIVFIFSIIFGVNLAFGQSNDCSTATVIAPGATCVNTAGTTSGSTQSIPGCVGTADDDVWYQFTASATSHQITVTASAGFDPVVQLFSGACSALSTISCMDNGLTGESETIFATGLTVSQVYRIRVYHYYAGVPTTPTFSICVTNPPPVPSNNECAGATLLSVNTTCSATAGTSVGSSQSMAGCAGTADDDVWYRFVATNAVQTITVDPSVNMDPVLELFSGTCGSLTSISCMDVGFTDGNEVINAVGLTPGQTYYIRVYDYYSSTGGAAFNICVVGAATSAPVNDEPCNAINLPAVTTTCNYLTFSSLGATTTATPGAPSSCSGGSAPQQGGYANSPRDVWFAITVPSTGNITVTIKPGLASPMNDMVFVLYSGTCGSLTQITCSDDYDYPGSSNDMQPFINRTGLTPGSTVYLRVFRFGSDGSPGADPRYGGDFGLCVSTNTNDACANALYICDLNGYSASTSAAFTADRPGTGTGQMHGNNETAAGVNLVDGTNADGPFGYFPYPGTTPGVYSSPALDVNIENNSWIRFTAGATTAILNVTVGNCFVGGYPSGGIQMQIFSASACNNFLPVSQFRENSTGFTITASGLTIGSDYYLMVDGYANDVCNYTISANSGVLFPDIIASANPICSGASTLLTAPSGATAYEWQPGGVTTQTLTVSPSTTTTYTCFVSGVCGQRQTLTKTITVNQLPSMTSSTAPAAICSGQTVGLALTSDIPSAYSWTVASNTDVTGEANGSGSPISNTLTVTSLTNENVIYTITPTSNVANGSCAGPAQTVTVTVKPRPTLTDPTNQTVCAGSAIAATNFSTNISGTTVSWTNAGSTLTGISASGSTDIAGYTAPTVSSQQVSTITATPTLNGCAGLTPQTFVITVNPTPQFSSTMSNPSYCGGSASTTISFPAYSPSSGGSIGWTNSNTTAGVNGVGITLASGAGNITSYLPPMVTATQTTSISITPSIGSCSGTAQTVTLTVNPTPVLSAVASPTVCGGNNTSVSFSTSPTATVNWTNSNANSGITGIGLTNAIGAGDITSFPTPLVAATQTAVINATPLLGSCTGSARQFTITVNPTPVINAVPSPTVCGNTAINAVNFTAAPNSPVIWTSSSTSTGLSVATGTATVSGFTSANVLSLTTSTITLNTTLNSCPAAQVQYTITVNPLPRLTVTPTEVQSACGLSTGQLNGASASGAGALNYVWTNSVPVQVGNTPNITGMPAGSYNLTVTDANCTASFGPFDITNPGAPAQPTAIAVDNTLCVGEALSLSSTSSEVAPTFAWSGPNASSSTSTLNIGAVTLADAGTYTVTVTVSNCTSTNTITVAVNPNPTPGASSSSAVYCSGSTIDLFGSGGTGFSWSGPDSYSSTNQNPQLTPSIPLMSGTYTLTVTDANGCDAITTTALTVSQTPPAPSVNALPLNLCVGNDINLTATSTGATDYAWTGPNSYTSAQQNPTITNSTVLETGTYTVVATASNCPSQPATVNVTVNSNPVVTTGITGSPVCSGATVTLSADGGTSYAWTGPNTFTSGNQNPQLTNATVQMSGTYSVVVTDANNCSANGTVDLTVDQTPDLPVITASASSLCEGEDLQLDATSTGALNYSWLGPNGFTSPIANPLITNVTLTEGGTYTVTATATNCSSPSETITITVNPTPVATAAISSAVICSGNNIDLSSTGGATYSWTGPNGYTSSQADNTLTNVDATFTGVYTFTAINPGNCTDVATVSLTVNTTPSLPVITASGNALCEGESLQLDAVSTGSGTISYAWTGPNGFTSPISNPLLTNVTTLAGGTYTVTASTPDCSSPSETVSIVVNATPIATAAISSAIICSGNTINLTSTGGSTFSWAGPNGYTSTQADNTLTNVDVLATGTYTFTATNTGNCTDQATVSLVVNETPGLPVITANANTLCEGDNLQLNASSTGTGTISYTWSGPNGFTSPISNPLITGVTTLAAGTYTVTASTPDCASPSETVSISVNVTPVATAAISSATVCSGNTINLTSTGGTTFSWSGPNGYTSSQADNTLTNVDVNAAGTYTFTAINSGNCTDVATVTLAVTQTPSAAITIGDSTCVGNPITLTATGSGTINWYDDAALTNLVATGSTLNPNLATNTAGIYYVTVSNGGCVSTTSTVVASNFNINASFSASTLSGSAPLPVTFTNTSTGVDANDTYSWLISNSQFATTYNSAYNFTQGGSFNVGLIITDSPSGCKDTASVTVFVDDEIRVVIPNVFTPNGDGTNDGFVIEIKGGKDAEGTIFNRWGQVLHKWDALNVTWDGKVPNGEAVSDGIYFYIIKVTGYNGKVLDVPGNVTIVR